MKKDFFILIFLNSLLWGRTMNNNSSENTNTIESVKEDSVAIAEPFLKNTIYIFNDRRFPSELEDLSYTPSQHYGLDRITIEIKDNIAIVCTDVKIIHKIKSVKYYNIFSANGNSHSLAILKTDKGEIRISSNPSCIILYSHFIASTSISFFCHLPNER